MLRVHIWLFAMLVLGMLSPARAYAVDRMAAFQEAPRVVVVSPPLLQTAATQFARRFGRRRGAPVEVTTSKQDDAAVPTLELVIVVGGARTCTMTSERHVRLSGSVEQLVDWLGRLTGPPLAAEGAWTERRFEDEQGQLTVRYREGSLVASEIVEFARARGAERRRIAAAIGLEKARAGDVRYVLYETYEEKGVATKSLEDAHLDSDGRTIHLVHGWDARGDDGRELARLLLLRHAGDSTDRWLLVGMPLALASTPPPHDAFTRATRLALGGALPTAGELGDAEFWMRTSQRITGPAAAALARELLEEVPPGQVRAIWRAGHIDASDLARFRSAAVARLTANPGGVAGLDRATVEYASSFGRGGHRGFCLAHEGYRIHNGYVGASSARSLDDLVEIGCNWISVSPFLGFAETTSPRMGRVNRLPSRPGSETDEHVIQACTYARRRGMGVLLKPHLWSHRGWCGDLCMKSEADWQEFFANYGDFVMHYALLAAEHGIAALAVGNELPGTTLTREADWRRLIARVRGVYPGKVIYCANWDREFEQLPFWDAVDACGVSCYFPLSTNDNPSDGDLRAGAQRVAARLERVARRVARPVIVTEVGYAPMLGTWREPFREHGGAFSAEAQERCFAAILGALRGRDWCLGVYVWKWPSFVGHGGANHRGYTPLGKPAMRAIGDFFAHEHEPPDER